MDAFNKKTLIVTSWAPPMIGGPQSLYNLLCHIEPTSYAILTKRPPSESEQQISGTKLDCQYYYSESAGNSSPHPARTVVNAIPYLGGLILGAIDTVISVRRILKSISELRHHGHVDRLLGISDTGQSLLATYLAHRRWNISYGVYFYDLYRGNNLGVMLGLLARWLEPRLLRNASLVSVTNEGTAQYLQRRYGSAVNIQVIHNSVEASRYSAPTNAVSNPPYTILFTGHVYWAQQQAVLNMVRAMNELRDLPLRLDLYVPKANRVITEAVRGVTNIRLTAAPQAEMPTIQAQATLLFLPLAWHTSAPDIIATATPGKFTDYLAAGRPMLIHAPDYAYVSRYAREHQLGLVIDQDDPHLLAVVIRDFLNHPDRGDTYVQQAQRIFHQNHDAATNAKKLTELLNMV